MSRIDLGELRESFSRHHIKMCFNGPLSDTIIEELGSAVKRHMEKNERPKSAIFDVFSVFIEQTQNIRSYMAGKGWGELGELRLDTAILVISQRDNHYLVCSGNVIETADAPALAQRLDALVASGKAELKALYKDQLRKPRIPGNGGGLGLIEMARKAAEPPRYTIEAVDERFSFFSLEVAI